MPHTTPHRDEAFTLLQTYLRCVQQASRPIDHDAVHPADQRAAQARLHTEQSYLIEVIAAGLATGDVLF